MASVATADLVISRVIVLAAHVAGNSAGDALYVLVYGFDAPEAAGAESSSLQAHNTLSIDCYSSFQPSAQRGAGVTL